MADYEYRGRRRDERYSQGEDERGYRQGGSGAYGGWYGGQDRYSGGRRSGNDQYAYGTGEGGSRGQHTSPDYDRSWRDSGRQTGDFDRGYSRREGYGVPEDPFANVYGGRLAREYDYGTGHAGESQDYGRGYRGSRGDDDRGFFERAGDEVKSWFGDDDAERRRRMDAREGDSGAQHHRGRGPRGYKRSDDRIREDVNDRLTDDMYLDASNVDVTVSEGEVTLSGTVESRSDKRRAEDLAESVSGVGHVQNNLRVKPSTGMSGSKDSLRGAASTFGNDAESSTRGSTFGTTSTNTSSMKS